jgi:hypothetical protein
MRKTRELPKEVLSSIAGHLVRHENGVPDINDVSGIQALVAMTRVDRHWRASLWDLRARVMTQIEEDLTWMSDYDIEVVPLDDLSEDELAMISEDVTLTEGWGGSYFPRIEAQNPLRVEDSEEFIAVCENGLEETGGCPSCGSRSFWIIDVMRLKHRCPWARMFPDAQLLRVGCKGCDFEDVVSEGMIID